MWYTLERFIKDFNFNEKEQPDHHFLSIIINLNKADQHPSNSTEFDVAQGGAAAFTQE